MIIPLKMGITNRIFEPERKGENQMSNQDNLKRKTEDQGRYLSHRQERMARRAERRIDRQAGGLGWMAGLIMIAIGAFYLLHQVGVLPALANWWALFLLLPGVGTLSAALGAYRSNGGRWTPEVTGPFLGGLLFLALTAVFLFGIDYGWLWPLFLIAAGLLLLTRPFFKGTLQ
jgi:hypothetical protein